jgi:hypothetical protein
MKEGSDPKNSATGDPGIPQPGPNSPSAKAAASWEMPAPIFRVSDGVEVKKTEVQTPTDANGQGDADDALAKLYAPPESEMDAGKQDKGPTAPPPAVEIRPQPYISEEFTLKDIAEPLPPEEKGNPVMRKVLTVFGVFCMVLFIITFLGVVYFLFFYKSDAGSGF